MYGVKNNFLIPPPRRPPSVAGEEMDKLDESEEIIDGTKR